LMDEVLRTPQKDFYFIWDFIFVFFIILLSYSYYLYITVNFTLFLWDKRK